MFAIDREFGSVDVPLHIVINTFSELFALILSHFRCNLLTFKGHLNAEDIPNLPDTVKKLGLSIRNSAESIALSKLLKKRNLDHLGEDT